MTPYGKFSQGQISPALGDQGGDDAPHFGDHLRADAVARKKQQGLGLGSAAG